MASSWSCPHEANDLCAKVNDLPCNPGMKGCVLSGRYVFFNEEKNERLRQRHGRCAPDAGAHKGTGAKNKR
jgi:hypothetical protein